MVFLRAILVCSWLLAINGCSLPEIRFPWQQSGVPEKGRLLDLLGPHDAKSAAQVDKSRKTLQLPHIAELADAGLQPLSQKALKRCGLTLRVPPEKFKLAESSNFGNREPRDSWGRTLQSRPQLIVVHETVISGPQTVALFQTHHPNDDQQASYHLLIERDGSRLRVVPDVKRAFGAGMSAFGDVTQRAKPNSVGSINNIALHVSLVSPEDGRDDRDSHSGYTEAQYKTLAGQVLLWQAEFGIPMTRLTTHAAVDRSRSRYDPRSFRWDRFNPHYHAAVAACGFSQFDNQQAGP